MVFTFRRLRSHSKCVLQPLFRLANERISANLHMTSKKTRVASSVPSSSFENRPSGHFWLDSPRETSTKRAGPFEQGLGSHFRFQRFSAFTGVSLTLQRLDRTQLSHKAFRVLNLSHKLGATTVRRQSTTQTNRPMKRDTGSTPSFRSHAGSVAPIRLPAYYHPNHLHRLHHLHRLEDKLDFRCTSLSQVVFPSHRLLPFSFLFTACLHFACKAKNGQFE